MRHTLRAKLGFVFAAHAVAFIPDGGVVVMCQTCSAAAGLKFTDHIDAVKMGDWPTVSGHLFAPMIKSPWW